MRSITSKGFEACFAVHQACDTDRYCVGTLTIGDADSIGPDNRLHLNPGGDVVETPRQGCPDRRSEWSEVEDYTLLHLHSHPGLDNVLPSSSDLGHTHLLRRDVVDDCGLAVRPIAGILSRDGRGRYGLLLYQEHGAAGLTLDEIDDLSEEIFPEHPSDPHETVAEQMQAYSMYRATALRPNRYGRFIEQDLTKTRRFCFSPRIVNATQLGNALKGEAYWREQFEAATARYPAPQSS